MSSGREARVFPNQRTSERTSERTTERTSEQKKSHKDKEKVTTRTLLYRKRVKKTQKDPRKTKTDKGRSQATPRHATLHTTHVWKDVHNHLQLHRNSNNGLCFRLAPGKAQMRGDRLSRRSVSRGGAGMLVGGCGAG